MEHTQLDQSVATWVFLIPLLAIGFALFMGSRRSGHRICQRSSPERGAPRPHRSASRFPSGFFTGVLGGLAVVGAIAFFSRLGTPRDPAVLLEDRPVEVISDQEIEQLLTRVGGRGSTLPTPIPVTVPHETEENVPAEETELTSLSATDELHDAETLKVTLYESNAADGRPAAELPEWTARNDESDGLPRVIHSGQNATVSDAEAEAVSLLVVELGEAFVKEHPEAAGWTPPVELIRSIGVIGRRAIQESEVTVGEFSEPVFQAYLEVVPSANLESELFTAWRAGALQSRLLLVGGAIGLLTLLFGSLAGYFHLDAATRGKYRNPLMWGTAAMWIAAGSALAILA